mgnify:CR=1 FL=1
MITRVLPVPAPAKTRFGPWILSTASNCLGFSKDKYSCAVDILLIL